MQKRAYKALAFICHARHDFTVPHLKEVLETLLAGVTSSLSAAKRYRLQCLQVALAPCLQHTYPACDGPCNAQFDHSVACTSPMMYPSLKYIHSGISGTLAHPGLSKLNAIGKILLEGVL